MPNSPHVPSSLRVPRVSQGSLLLVQNLLHFGQDLYIHQFELSKCQVWSPSNNSKELATLVTDCHSSFCQVDGKAEASLIQALLDSLQLLSILEQILKDERSDRLTPVQGRSIRHSKSTVCSKENEPRLPSVHAHCHRSLPKSRCSRREMRF